MSPSRQSESGSMGRLLLQIADEDVAEVGSVTRSPRIRPPSEATAPTTRATAESRSWSATTVTRRPSASSCRPSDARRGSECGETHGRGQLDSIGVEPAASGRAWRGCRSRARARGPSGRSSPRAPAPRARRWSRRGSRPPRPTPPRGAGAGRSGTGNRDRARARRGEEPRPVRQGLDDRSSRRMPNELTSRPDPSPQSSRPRREKSRFQPSPGVLGGETVAPGEEPRVLVPRKRVPVRRVVVEDADPGAECGRVYAPVLPEVDEMPAVCPQKGRGDPMSVDLPEPFGPTRPRVSPRTSRGSRRGGRGASRRSWRGAGIERAVPGVIGTRGAWRP